MHGDALDITEEAFSASKTAGGIELAANAFTVFIVVAKVVSLLNKK